MSQAGILDVEASTPTIPTSFSTDSGTAIPVLNTLEIDGGTGVNTSGAGNVVTVNIDSPVVVANGGTGQTTLTDGSILVGNAAAAIEEIGPLTDGQLLIGDTAGVSPVASTLTAGTGITIVNAAGSITLSAGAAVALSFPTDSGTATPAANALTVSGGTGINTSGSGSTVTVNLDSPVTEINGGTNQTTYTTGDILYASAANTLSKLAVGTNADVLTLAAGIPGWAAPTVGTVTSVSGTTNRISSTGGATPVIDIDAAYVGQASLTTLGTVTTGIWNATSISETNGGTNQSTYTTGDVLYASAANTLSKLAVGTNADVLTLAAGVPSWAAPVASVSAGDIITQVYLGMGS